MCGRLHLDAETPADIGILTMMYKHVFSFARPSGTIVVLDADGKEMAKFKFLGVEGEKYDDEYPRPDADGAL
jgi:hypothetical protein